MPVWVVHLCILHSLPSDPGFKLGLQSSVLDSVGVLCSDIQQLYAACAFAFRHLLLVKPSREKFKSQAF